MTAALVLSLAARAPTAGAQGTVMQQDPRRPPPMEQVTGCEIWQGFIAGNDPTAEAWVELCAEGEHVTGVFQWSSLESGWDRRALAGDWTEDHTVLTLRDTQMLEVHPRNGWTLCTADRYDLRLTAPGRVEGSYVSAACHDRGTIRMTFRNRIAGPDGSLPSPLPTTPATASTESPQSTHRAGLRCTAQPGRGASAPWPLTLVALGLAAARRRRQ